jgi:hypothetical protein
LLQLPPVSQQPAHSGQGWASLALASVAVGASAALSAGAGASTPLSVGVCASTLPSAGTTLAPSVLVQ